MYLLYFIIRIDGGIVLHSDFEEALGYANQLNYYSLPQNAKRITESQLVTLNKWEKIHKLPLTKPED